MADVAITQNSEIEQAISAAVEHMPIADLVRDKRVAIKPNETWASEEDQTGVTQPDTLHAVLRFVKRFGPQGVIVTGGSGAVETEEVFRVAGLQEVVIARHGDERAHAVDQRSTTPKP